MQKVLVKLFNVQQSLKCNKSKFNKFGGFNYRSCEDILESAKPLLKDNKCVIIPSDEVVEIGGRLFIKATQTILDIESGESYSTSAMAEIPSVQGKKMDEPQCTGSASSYARKYALNGLFMLDDSELDSDSQDTTKKEPKNDNKPNVDEKVISARNALIKYCKEHSINMLELTKKYPSLKDNPSEQTYLGVIASLEGGVK